MQKIRGGRNMSKKEQVEQLTDYMANFVSYIAKVLPDDIIAKLDELAEKCQKILNTEYSDKLDELYRLGGTSGGARPKIMTTIDEEE